MTLGVSGILCTLSVEGSLLAENQGFTFTGNQGISLQGSISCIHRPVIRGIFTNWCW